MPQRFSWRNEPERTGWNRSAAKTPAWQVKDDATSTALLSAAKVKLSLSACAAHSASGITERTVKYMANKPAKNISSLASHTIVPTDTGFGRLTLTCWWAWGAAAVAVDTRAIMADCRSPRTTETGG